MRKRPGRLDPRWYSAGFALQPSPGELRACLLALVERYNERGAAMVLGVPVNTLRRWVERGLPERHSASRLVWITHALLLAPDKLQSAFDLVTWGRFRVERRVVRKPVSEWSDWSV